MNARPTADGATPPFRAIDHIGIAVDDLDAAITLYTTTFGLRLLHVEDNPDQGVREAMLAPGTEPADGSSGPKVQLVAPLTADSPVTKFLRSRKPGLHHLAFGVDNLAAAATTLRGSGVDLLYEDSGRPGTGGSRVNFVHPREAGGILLELVEAPPSST